MVTARDCHHRYTENRVASPRVLSRSMARTRSVVPTASQTYACAFLTPISWDFSQRLWDLFIDDFCSYFSLCAYPVQIPSLVFPEPTSFCEVSSRAEPAAASWGATAINSVFLLLWAAGNAEGIFKPVSPQGNKRAALWQTRLPTPSTGDPAPSLQGRWRDLDAELPPRAGLHGPVTSTSTVPANTALMESRHHRTAQCYHCFCRPQRRCSA